ncbi:MAG: hypothetical protein JXA89_00240 [Anaerolineae bacterium]|nr:hypothetical protein [Anaerolineae bacterium]
MLENKRRANLQSKIVIIVIVTLVACLLGVWLYYLRLFSGGLSKATPEQIFSEYVWQYNQVPSQVTQIKGIAGVSFGYNGPAILRFKASESFITEMIEKDYGYNGLYVPSPCANFFDVSSKDQAVLSSNELEWWTPENIASPTCYHAQGYQADDSRYLLIDSNNGLVYFYRTATCALCPD